MSHSQVVEEGEGPSSGGTGHVLPAERACASFRTQAMTNLLDGGEDKTRRRRWIVGQSEGRELGLERYHLSRAQLLERHVRDFVEIHAGFGKRMAEGSFRWAGRASRLQIVGSYAQTELGHGSNVRGLRTTASFDAQADEWVLNTPVLTAIKWWPGGVAKLATHALVYAQLLLNGRSHGVHAFMLQLRDEWHQPLPGIELGELGPKMGDSGHDSGCLRLHNARIPRSNLLARHQHITREGRYVSASGSSGVPLHYSSMLLTRASWVQLAGGQLAKACTIAVRYSAVRRQGPGEGPERQLLDHTVQRRRLLVQVATAYAVKLAARTLLKRVAALEEPELPIAERLRLAPALAADAGGLKAVATLLAADGIEDLRRCCGGNGYLLSSGIAALALDDLWHVTAEGDYVVLLLASARFHVKRSESHRPTSNGTTMASVEDWTDPGKVLTWVSRLADLAMAAASAAVVAERSKGLAEDDIFNSAAENLATAAAWRGRQALVAALLEQRGPAELMKVLGNLAALLGCHFIVTHTGVEFTVAGSHLVPTAIQLLCANLRPDAVALVDAFDYEDRVLNSTLGLRSGNVYEALYEASKRSAKDFEEPFRGYKEYLRPLLDTHYLKQGADTAKRSRL